MADDRILSDDDDDDLPVNRTAADRDTNPGHPASGVRTDYQRTKTRRRVLLLLGTLLLAGTGSTIYLWSRPKSPVKSATAPQQTTPTFTAPQPNVTAPVRLTTPQLGITPRNFNFGEIRLGDPKRVQTFMLTPETGTFEITGITIPYGADQGFTLGRSEARCEGKTLRRGDNCTIAVTYDPRTPSQASVMLTIVGTAFDTTTGQSKAFTNVTELTGLAVEKVARPAPTLEQTLQVPANPLPNTDYLPPDMPAPTAIDTGAIDNGVAEARAALQAARQKPSSGGATFLPASAATPATPRSTPRAPRRPIDQDWSDAGFTPNVSSYPVDMTRILTMDKPIPAVIKNTIDSRMASPAVAVVERDLYGNDGRMVLIERGSILVGRAQTVTNTATEKVQIIWQRLQRPDGVIFKMTAASGDAMGRAGVLSHNDNRYGERFGAALLATVIEVASIAAINGTVTTNNTGGTNTGGAVIGGSSATTFNGRAIASQSLQQNLEPQLRAFEQERLRIPPIRMVPAGTRITVWATQDLLLRPPETPESIALEDQRPQRGPAPVPSQGTLQQPNFQMQNSFSSAGAPRQNPYAYPPSAQTFPDVMQPSIPLAQSSEPTNPFGTNAADALAQAQRQTQLLQQQLLMGRGAGGYDSIGLLQGGQRPTLPLQ